MKYAYVQFLCNRIANRLVVYNVLILHQQIIGYVPFLNSQVPIPCRVNEVCRSYLKLKFLNQFVLNLMI